MDKSADAFRTISEVAEHLETPAHVLRFWESRFPQIRPVKRAGGRRYYRPSDVALLTGIKRLLHDEGMTIRGVQKILREQGVRHVSGVAADAADGEIVDDAAYSDQVIDQSVPTQPTPAQFRPAPGLAEAMAKAVDYRSSDAKPAIPSSILQMPQLDSVGAARAEPSPTGPSDVGPSDVGISDVGLSDVGPSRAEPPPAVIAPAQGALLLTPSARGAGQGDGRDRLDDIAAAADDAIAAMVRASQQDPAPQADIMAKAPDLSLAAFPETAGDTADFDDDDFDEGPAHTLASRIRALPHGASAAKVGAELLSVVARLQALRDTVAQAAQTGQA